MPRIRDLVPYGDGFGSRPIHALATPPLFVPRDAYESFAIPTARVVPFDGPASQPRVEIAFVDAAVADLESLLAGLRPGVEVVLLDGAHDALGQIAGALAGRESIAAIHIIANGAEGRIEFGAGSVGLSELAGHSEELAAIAGALSADADILLWTCDTGAGSAGQAFVDALALATGADVAASTDATGAAGRGGDWVLELHSGPIDAGAPLTPAGIDGYAGLLDDEPNGTDATLTAQEDTDYVFAVADFGFDDGVEDNDLVGVTITTLPGAGTLYLLDGVGGGTAVTAGQSVAAGDIDASLLIFRPEDEASGTNYADFTFQVQDDGGSNDIDTTPNTITFDVTAVNDAPFLDLDYTDFTASGNDSAASWSVGDAPVILAFAVELDDDDPDNSYPGATLTVSFSANGTTDDQLSIFSVGDDLGELRVTGSNIYYEGTLVGTFIGGDDGSDLVVTFNADACHCAVQLVIQSITFTNDSATPDTNDRTLAFTFVDGGGDDFGGADTASALVTLEVSAANVAPTVAITTHVTAASGETLVNTTTNNSQNAPSAAALEGGGHVVTWYGNGVGDAAGVFMQRYDASGAALGSEVRVNSTTTNDQGVPTVAALAGGGYVVAWQSLNQDGSLNGIYAQRFDSSGTAVGAEVRVNSHTDDAQLTPSVTGLSDGGYVIAWSSASQESSDVGGEAGIYLQRYDADGAAVDGEMHVNTTEAGNQIVPVVAALGDGGYLVVWQSANDIHSQRYDASGAPSGAETVVSAVPSSTERDPTIAVLSDGGYVIAWEATALDGDGEGIYAQRYDASGAPVGGAFQVNTYTTGLQVNPAITALPDGGYVIAWQSDGQDGSAPGVYAQRYDDADTAVGGEQRINTTTTNSQNSPTIVTLGDGSYSIAWSGNGIGDSLGIFSQRFDSNFGAVEQVPLDIKGTITLDDADDSGGSYTVTLSVTEGVLNVDPGTSGVAVDDSDQQNIVLTGTLAEIQALLGSDPTSSVTYTYDDDFLPYDTIELSVEIDDGTDTATETTVISLTPVNDAAELDLDFFAPGNDATLTYVEGDGPVPLAFYATFDDDNVDWDGATLTVAIASPGANDTLSIVEDPLGDLEINGFNVLYQGDIVGTWSGGTNGDPLVVTFNELACACAVELVTASIAFENTDDLSAADTRSVTFTFVDGDGTANSGTDTATATVTVELLPFPEVITGGTASGDEDAAIALTGVAIDGLARDPATDLITVRLVVANGTLDIRTDVSGGIDSGDIEVTGGGSIITIHATQDQINATLAASGGLTYQGDPDYNGPDTLSIFADDISSATPIMLVDPIAIPVDGLTTALAAVDLDGDTIPDLILAFDETILVSTSSGATGGYSVDGVVTGFAFGDFDGDGIVDIGYSDYAAGGTGSISYISSFDDSIVSVAGVAFAAGLVSGDFNGDGLTDLATIEEAGRRVGIIIQDSPGTFLAPVFSTAAIGTVGVALVAGDFNGDGILDLLSSYDDTVAGGSVKLMIGNPDGSTGHGDGTFGAATDITIGTGHARFIATGDFNGDGMLDFAIGLLDASFGVQVMLGNGDGTFDDSGTYITSADGIGGQIVAADLNGDGVLDLAVANGDDPGSVSILAGNGDGTFRTPVDLDPDAVPYSLAAADIDGDGDVDLAVGSEDWATFYDNDGEPRTADGTKNILVAPVADATNDAASPVAENATVVIDVLANDSNVGGSSPQLATVNGATLVNPGDSTLLASGAKVTLNADGTLTYSPNNAFRYLITTATAAATNAVNSSAEDSFTYTLVGGDSGTVAVTVTGVTSTGDQLRGDAGNNTIIGTGAADLIMLNQGGTDSATGGEGTDGFYFGGALDALDSVDGGNGADDQLAVQGDYSGGNRLTFGAGNLVGIETFVLLPGNDARFGAPAGTYSYDFTTIEENVADGKVLLINAQALRVGENLTFDGRAETDGTFMFYGGRGIDDLTGGQGSDGFFFGAGRFAATDRIDGQGGADDQFGLRGDYSSQIVFGAETITNIETIVLLSATDTRFGTGGGTSFSYNLKLDDGNIANNGLLTINARFMIATESATIDASDETGGAIHFWMGSGNDTVIGGGGDDLFYGLLGQDAMTGGGGDDTFYFTAAAQSQVLAMDHITDFTAGDLIDLTDIDANSLIGGNDAFAFIGTAAFGHVAGELRATAVGNDWTVEGDIDGDGVADFAILVTTTGGHTLGPSDFAL